MAGTTIRISGWMIGCGVFSYGKDIIMASHAVSVDTNMSKCCGYEAGGFMAHTAIISGRHMVVGFSYGGFTMTCHTVSHDALVIKLSTGKGCGVMAQLTILSSLNVGRISFGALTGGGNSMA